MSVEKDRLEAPAEPGPFFVAYRDGNPDGLITVFVDASQLESPRHAGLILADFARHIARAMWQSGKAESEEQALREVDMLFRVEIDHPTGSITGLS